MYYTPNNEKMAGVNRVVLLGNVGADPEVRHLDSGVSVARIRLATTETYRDKEGQKRDITEWHNVVMWRGLAKIAEEYIKKGSQIFIEGKIRSNNWEDDQGNQRRSIEIVADNLQMLGRPGSSQADGSNNYQKPAGQANQGASEPESPDFDAGGGDEADDLPF